MTEQTTTRQTVHRWLLLTMLWLGVGARVPAQAVISVDTTPALDIPGTAPSGRIHFEVAVGATRLSDGRIVVADRGASALRVFDRGGQAVQTVGRRGSGPGEFRRVDWIGQCGPDSLFVWDRVGQQLSVVDAAGRFVYQGRFPGDSGMRGTPVSLSCSRSGVLTMLMLAPIQAAAEAPFLERGRSNLVRANTRGSDLRLLAAVTGSERLAIEDAIFPRPLGRTTTVAVGRDRVYVATGDAAVVSVLALDGATISTIAVGIPARRPTQQELDRAVDRLPVPSIQAQRSPISERLKRLPLPAALPPYRKVYVDPDGFLWAVVSPEGASMTELRIVDPAGRASGRVVVPREITVLDIDHDFLLAAHEDGAGEPHVLAFRIRRPR